jgi:hypothetical protein
MESPEKVATPYSLLPTPQHLNITELTTPYQVMGGLPTKICACLYGGLAKCSKCYIL